VAKLNDRSMFLLLYDYHIVGHQRGISIQSCINLGETFFEERAHRSKLGKVFYRNPSYPSFLNSFIEQLWFLFLMAWYCKPAIGEHSLCCILFNNYMFLCELHLVTCTSFSELNCSSSNSKRHTMVDETFVQVQQEHGKHTPHGLT